MSDTQIGSVAIRAYVGPTKEPMGIAWVWKHDFPLSEKHINRYRAECIDAIYRLALENKVGEKIGYFIEFSNKD